ncbi:MAG: type II secretion system F family protein [Peptoclostridium sp.]|uniref:type II secretion system F family protein n=1 Tax=Peptoclostridium sp. TaxID=1904860 RepID=UPI00139DB455|nr:type II secretion system F family protein [Peptoclostridium sp.]MZQ76186.1 type II secretion system F family protein [Peptoclostridium sp.]
MDWTFAVSSLGISFFLYLAINAVLAPTISIKRRLGVVEQLYGEEDNVADVRQLPFKERLFVPFQKKLKNEVSKKTPKGIFEQLELKAERAGEPYGIGATGWIVIRIVFAAIIPILAVFLMVNSDYAIAMKVLLVICSFAVAWLLPNMLLDYYIRNRGKVLTRQLPDALDILTVSVESGLSFDSAVAKLVEKSKNDIAKEFEKVMSEVQLGKTRRDALKNMAQRCDADDVRVFISAIIQAEQLGVSIGRVLRIQAGQIRTKRKQRAEELAMKAPIKMVIPLVFFVFPGLFVVILGPALIQIKNSLL